ncbi:hypothetical protein DTO166G4_2978 [Paecilomyces variotii]|nr:hypothetical protein DTO166G4_2978 [Paecilomyces variotii]KAJ9234985.1 hypothetical protein DTO166G5_4806 [Paecilomyces variotii]KAJ9260729.1 hypothetical protein DTO195F2_4342 [Paecilomyces variotii]KAJ9348933.1 hypothetical protein DTO027B9_7959 [Paecilomyces variotii]KAJ9367160.1 hypothetical protein DTO282E5_8129 [Paecilomyces variotii]
MAPPVEQSTPLAASVTASTGQNSKVTPSSVSDKETRAASSTRGPSIDSPRHEHWRFVFTDPVAFRYLEEDPLTVVLHRRTTLQGYEIYLVEQWACSRVHPTFIITTYTGDPSHTVVVGVLSVPTDESTWSPRLKLYFQAVTQYHARKNDTPLGTLMVTNLSAFPSALTVIPVPDGDVKKHRDDFIVNEDLKRLGCSGRAGLKLQPPSPATEAKFHQLYRTSERVPIYSAVIELVKQCQLALMIFDKLAAEYVDGLLCDVTERAINDWWTDIGTDLYNIEPSDGILGPTTVAALLGTLMGARNRLHAFGAPVGKDAFDIPSLKRGIGSFQKSQKLNRTRRLDRQTLDKLHRVTAKAASSEGWTDAVKSTVAELSGKGGEMVMGMVGGKDKAGIADIETLDLDRFAQLVNGQRAKWLWRGKRSKTGAFGNDPTTGEMVFTRDDQGGYLWTSRRRHSNEDLAIGRPTPEVERPSKPQEVAEMTEDRDQPPTRGVLRGVSGKVSDARIGFGRFKEAVGLPGLRSHHHHKHTKEGVDLESDLSYTPTFDSDTEGPTTKESHKLANQLGQQLSPRQQEQNGTVEKQARPPDITVSSETGPPEIAVQPMTPVQESAPPDDERGDKQELLFPPDENDDDRLELIKSYSTEGPSDREQLAGLSARILRRSQSFSAPLQERDSSKDSRWPRHLSFSTVEEIVLVWEGVRGSRTIKRKSDAGLEGAILQEEILTSDTQIFGSRILELGQRTLPWVEKQVDAVDSLNQRANSRQEELGSIYLELLHQYQSLREESGTLLAKESSDITEGLKQVEMLGAKLDYELNVLESRVEDVEAGLEEFERHVIEIETRTKDLIQGEKGRTNSWFSWMRRTLEHIVS